MVSERRCRHARCPHSPPPLLLLLTLLLVFRPPGPVLAAMDECYAADGRAQRCLPEFMNAAFNATVRASATCGTPPEEYCVQTGVTGVSKSCHVCDSQDPVLHHNASLLMDFNNLDEASWWQSPSMLRGAQFPSVINLTLHLGKAFDITYVRLKFHTSRPESFAIYKRTSPTSDWQPYQYYSGSCLATYGLSPQGFLRTGDDETTALCTAEFSDISPLTNANVAFSTLEGRPSAYIFDTSSLLQEWVTSTEIRVTLNRLNTFGDEVFNDPKVLRSYYYAISDFSVGGRCKCNGHASECAKDESGHLTCHCRHGTAGRDCEHCLPLYNDRPWRRATANNAYECKSCDCNNLADECTFDLELFRATGRGGRCVNCRDDAAGIHCEHCRDGYYRHAESSRCLPCNCSPIGSVSEQCNEEGKCVCRPGVTGNRCNHCQSGFHSLDQAGCRPCECQPAGMLEQCLPDSGHCICKEHVEGQNCDSCRPGFFNLAAENPLGCSACFCHGHSSVCHSSSGYTAYAIASDFSNGAGGWQAKERGGQKAPTRVLSDGDEISVSSDTFAPIYFSAPAQFLGNQLPSYGHNLSFLLRADSRDARLTAEDLVLEGAGRRVTLPFVAQGNPYPTEQVQRYTFLLHETSDYPWRPQLSTADFQRLLSNLTALHIRALFNMHNSAYLRSLHLESARRDALITASPATWVEECSCPKGYQGQLCEACDVGYTRDPPGAGPFASCVPCPCHGHSKSCHPETGECNCKDNTAGDQCHLCAEGYYGDATQGTAGDCSSCPCPGTSSCAMEPHSASVICTDCPDISIGRRCEFCEDGFFGDPLGLDGPRRPCKPCNCHGNVDANAVGNCDGRTGECLKCVGHTEGSFCDRCRDGYYGNATGPGSEKCKPCACYPAGTFQGRSSCDQVTGQCACLPHVTDRACSTCKPGYYNISTGTGCTLCVCDPTGSVGAECDEQSGQCDCKHGVIGRTCNLCAALHYGFSADGCTPCACDPLGSLALQCDEDGNCPCRDGAVGRRCDHCRENFYRNSTGGHEVADQNMVGDATSGDVTSRSCAPCPPCYGLVQEKAASLRAGMAGLEKHMETAAQYPDIVRDDEFHNRLAKTSDSISILLSNAEATREVDKKVEARLPKLGEALARERGRLQQAQRAVDGTANTLEQADNTARRTKLHAEAAREQLEEARLRLETVNIERRNTSDPHNLTGLVDEARRLADKHHDNAAQVEATADEALNKSRDALDTLRHTLSQQNSLAEDVEQVTESLTKARNLTNDMEKLADQVLDAATHVSQRADDVFNNATLAMPSVDTEGLEEQVDEFTNNTESLENHLASLQASLAQLENDMEASQKQARDTLQAGQRHQQVADEFLARVDAARAKAEAAVDAGNHTLQDAKNILSYLRDFDRRVADNQTAAKKALKRVPKVKQLLQEAMDTTTRAEGELGSAKRDAQEALKVARQAESVANNTHSVREPVAPYIYMQKSSPQLRSSTRSCAQC
uniref:Laminin subunit gamma-3 n=1 Tax=Eptatretus burgeri TaxID=7764 RepID=A0A8C4QKG3_EPTBU